MEEEKINLYSQLIITSGQHLAPKTSMWHRKPTHMRTLQMTTQQWHFSWKHCGHENTGHSLPRLWHMFHCLYRNIASTSLHLYLWCNLKLVLATGLPTYTSWKWNDIMRHSGCKQNKVVKASINTTKNCYKISSKNMHKCSTE